MNSSKLIYKIVVLGEGRVGKTSMTLKYAKNEFNDNEQSSINACYVEKDIRLSTNNKIIKLAIWDTAGQQKYNAVAPVYYRDAVGAIIVYEIISRESFEKVKKWVNQLQEHCNNKDIVIMIAGNKSDMERQRVVSKQQVDKYTKFKNIQHFFVSAKTGQNINELFQTLAEEISNVKQKNGIKVANNSKRGVRIKFDEKPQEQKTRKSCC